MDIKKIKTFADVLALNNLTEEEFNASLPTGLEQDEIAYRKLTLIAKTVNEDWEADWGNYGQTKYQTVPCDYVEGKGFSRVGSNYWLANCAVGSRLCFKTYELALWCGRTFGEIWVTYLIQPKSLKNETDYNKALKRYEKIKTSAKDHTEKMILVKLISEYESKTN